MSLERIFCSKIGDFIKSCILTIQNHSTKFLAGLKSAFLLLRKVEVEALSKNLTTHERFAVDFNTAQIFPTEFDGVMKFRSTGSTLFNGSKRLKRSYTGW